MCPLSTIKDLYEIVKECDKVVNSKRTPKHAYFARWRITANKRLRCYVPSLKLPSACLCVSARRQTTSFIRKPLYAMPTSLQIPINFKLGGDNNERKTRHGNYDFGSRSHF